MKPYDNTAPPADPDDPHAITLLSNLYLEIGLPLEAAVQSAIADLEAMSDEETADLCTT